MPAQQGISGDHDQFLRRDGTRALIGEWDAGNYIIRNFRFVADSGGLICLGEHGELLRIKHDSDEVMKIVGVSNNEAELIQKNATMTDLAGVGARAVMADVNGKLSAP